MMRDISPWGGTPVLRPASTPACSERVLEDPRRPGGLPHFMMAMLMVLVAGALLGADSSTEQGVIAFQQGHYLQATRLLADAVHANPHDEHARTFLALTRAATGHCPEAVTDLTDRFQKSENRDLARLAGLALAQCLGAQGDMAKAVVIAGQLEAKYPDDADVLYQAARIHMRAFNDATRRMFEKTPASYRVNQLSGEIFETQNKFTEAAAEYRKAIEKNPRALNLHFRLGRAILLESHSPEAVAQSRKACARRLSSISRGLSNCAPTFPKRPWPSAAFACRPDSTPRQSRCWSGWSGWSQTMKRRTTVSCSPIAIPARWTRRSEEHTSELQSL